MKILEIPLQGIQPGGHVDLEEEDVQLEVKQTK